MLRISKKADRAIIILAYLAESPGRYCSANEIAQHFEIARPVIANILKMLTKSGLVKSKQGIRGGYQLARDPSHIKLSEVLQAVGELFAFARCVEMGSNGDPSHSELSGRYPSELALRYVHQEMYKMIERVTLVHLTGDLTPPVNHPLRETAERSTG